MIKIAARALLLIGMAVSAHAEAGRQPVLGQIDLPHPYYYREMFLPQLTSGPSSLAWSPDSTELVYSMAGSLWRQNVDSGVATQLTAATAYDYQPDWSPEGRWVIYASYRDDAIELWALDLASGAAHALTRNGAVNVEPRFSPDGRRIVFTSTLYQKRFHVFTADFTDGALTHIVRLTGEHRSELPRYYYSPFDHEINPIWSRDGREIIYVSNRGHIYGTGGFWRIGAPAPGAAPLPDAEERGAGRQFHYEETNWKARPDLSPDGSRLVYSSYLGGRSWHTLWLMPAGGGDAFPVTYGDWDMTYPRWSPDGTRIAFVSNQGGNTSIGWIRIPGGLVQPIKITERRYLAPMATLKVVLGDGAGHPAAARVSVTDSAGRFYAPDDAWIRADDGYDRRRRPFEAHYFHAEGETTLKVPAGAVHVEIAHGLERAIERRDVTVAAGAAALIAVNLAQGAWTVPDPGHWVSSDVHVHMNYGGTYRNDPAHLAAQALAENLSLVHALIVNKEQRFPDIAYSGLQLDPASRPDALVVHGQEYHTSYWGHLGLLDIEGGIILPGYAGYPATAASSLYPMNADVADMAHARHALVGYVHPFDEVPEPLAKPHDALTDELPVDVALGKVDYMEIVGFSDHRSTAAVWYRLLNLGFRIPAAAGTDAMANFASLRGPVGMNRVYVRMPEGERLGGETGVQDWLAGLKAGRSLATNGPLLGFTLGGAGPGDELKFAGAQAHVAFRARLKSMVDVDHLDLVCNGRVVRAFIAGAPADHADLSGTIPLDRSGWCLLRASSDAAREAVMDNYVYATTSPVYVNIAGKPARSPEDARYFLAWMDRLAEAVTAYPDWNNAQEKRGVQGRIAQAKSIYAGMQ